MNARIFLAVVAGAAVIAPAAALAQKSITLKFLTAWDNRYEGTQYIAYKYGEMLEKASKGRIKIKFSGPEVVKPRQQFQPTSAGVFDMNLSVAPYYIGTTGVTMAFFALPPDTEMWHREGYWDYADEEMQRFGQKIVSHPLGGSKSDIFQIMLKKPIAKVKKPLKGRKIRANGFYKPMVMPLGGSMVNLNGGEIYSALQRGVVDGAAWPILGAVNFKWYEVAPFMMRPRFGHSPYTVTMNTKRFNKLSKADQKLVMDLGRELERNAPGVFDAATVKEIAELKAFGVKETWLDKATFARVEKGFTNGVWSYAINFNKKTKARVVKLYEMAKAKGHAK